MFTIGWWLWKCSALLKNLIPAISGPWCRKTHECANYWLIVTSFLENLALISGLGYGCCLTKKNKWCSTHTAQVWRLSTCLSRWICTTPRSPGCNRNLGLIVTILQLSSQVQHHHYPHPVCQCSFITIDSSLSAPLLQVDFFNLHHLQFHGRCWWSATFPGVERSVYYSAHARDRVASLIQSSQEFAFVTSIR